MEFWRLHGRRVLSAKDRFSLLVELAAVLSITLGATHLPDGVSQRLSESEGYVLFFFIFVHVS